MRNWKKKQKKAELIERIKNPNASNGDLGNIKTLKILSIINLCIIPIFFSCGITGIVQLVFACIIHVKSENHGLKIATIILTIFTIIGGGITGLILANRELKK